MGNQVEFKDGKKIEIKNPPGLIFSSIDKGVEKLAKEKRKGELGVVHLSGKEIDIMFCFHILTLNLMKIFGEDAVIRALRIVFAKKYDELMNKIKFEIEVEQMRKDKKSNELSN